MNRHNALETICEVINSGILEENLENALSDVVSAICNDDFEPCDSHCLQRCKLDECKFAVNMPRGHADEDE